MNTSRFKILIVLLASLFIFPILAEELEEATEEETNSPSNPQQLLEIVRQGQFADTQEQRDRERKKETEDVYDDKVWQYSKSKYRSRFSFQ